MKLPESHSKMQVTKMLESMTSIGVIKMIYESDCSHENYPGCGYCLKVFAVDNYCYLVLDAHLTNNQFSEAKGPFPLSEIQLIIKEVGKIKLSLRLQETIDKGMARSFKTESYRISITVNPVGRVPLLMLSEGGLTFRWNETDSVTGQIYKIGFVISEI